MFFGLEVKSTQSKPIILENTTKLSQAVLEPAKNGKKEPVSLIAEYNKKQFILCVLDPNLSWQCPLDLLFEGGAQVKFSLRGSGTVHLTGYEPLDEFDDMNVSITSGSSSDEVDSEVESEDEQMEATPSKAKKVLTNGTGSVSKSAKLSSTSKKDKHRVLVVQDLADDSDSDDEDFELLEQAAMASSSSEENDDDDNSTSDDDADDADDNDDNEDDDDDEEDDYSDEEDDDDDRCQIEEMSEASFSE